MSEIDGFDDMIRTAMKQRAQMIRPDTDAGRRQLKRRIAQLTWRRRSAVAFGLATLLIGSAAVAGGGAVPVAQWARQSLDRVRGKRPDVVAVSVTSGVPAILRRWPTWVPSGMELVDAAGPAGGSGPSVDPGYHLIATDGHGQLRVQLERLPAPTRLPDGATLASLMVDGIRRSVRAVPPPPIKLVPLEATTGLAWQGPGGIVQMTVVGPGEKGAKPLVDAGLELARRVQEMPDGSLRLRPGSAFTDVRYAAPGLKGGAALYSMVRFADRSKPRRTMTLQVATGDIVEPVYFDLLSELFPSRVVAKRKVAVRGATARIATYTNPDGTTGGTIGWERDDLWFVVNSQLLATDGDPATVLLRAAGSVTMPSETEYEAEFRPVTNADSRLAMPTSAAYSGGTTRGVRWSLDHLIVPPLVRPGTTSPADAFTETLRLRTADGASMFLASPLDTKAAVTTGFAVFDPNSELTNLPLAVRQKDGRAVIAVVLGPGTVSVRFGRGSVALPFDAVMDERADTNPLGARVVVAVTSAVANGKTVDVVGVGANEEPMWTKTVALRGV